MSESSLLQDIPGVGSTRAAKLRDAGYVDVADVADETVGELIELYSISQPVARCIQEGAKEMRGDDGTVQAQIAAEHNVDRDDVATAFADMARLGVSVPEIKSFLIELFTTRTDSGSVVHFDEYSLQYRYYLQKSGFQTVADIAEASLDDLVEVKYIGEQTAENIKKAASESAPNQPSSLDDQTSCLRREEPDESSEPTTGHASIPHYHVTVESPDFLDWKNHGYIFAPRRFNPEMKRATPEYGEIMRYSKDGEGGLVSTFVTELGEIYELGANDGHLEIDYVTAIPGHTGDLSPQLVRLAIEFANEYDAHYKELVLSEGGSRRQRSRSLRHRWERQDELLSASRDLSNYSVIMIDDISTSGATLTTATHYLQEAGASNVVGFCLGLTYGQHYAVTKVTDGADFANIGEDET